VWGSDERRMRNEMDFEEWIEKNGPNYDGNFTLEDMRWIAAMAWDAAFLAGLNEMIVNSIEKGEIKNVTKGSIKGH
jgi:hypothetical protein